MISFAWWRQPARVVERCLGIGGRHRSTRGKGMDALDWITALLAIAAGVLSLFLPLVPYGSTDSTTQ
jgi:hypothetical protein